MLNTTVLAIETSCDETAVSIVRGYDTDAQKKFPTSFAVLAHQIHSQTESHAPFGGVVPEVAARDHLAVLPELVNKAIDRAGLTWSELDGIAVTLGPGLVGALMVGVLFGRGLATRLQKPLWGINHVDAHLAPALLVQNFDPQSDLGCQLLPPNIRFPSIGLTVSGGHCLMTLLQSPTQRILLGHNMDDACGEAFDKVAKLLGLPYPGGPQLEQLAKNCENKDVFNFPTQLSKVTNRYNFSYSGLKTAVLYAIQKHSALTAEVRSQIAYSFQKAAVGQLFNRVHNALIDSPTPIQSVLVAGGVACNQHFRQEFAKLSIPVVFAPASLCSDNATMIALQSFYSHCDAMEQNPFPRYNYNLLPKL